MFSCSQNTKIDFASESEFSTLTLLCEYMQLQIETLSHNISLNQPRGILYVSKNGYKREMQFVHLFSNLVDSARRQLSLRVKLPPVTNSLTTQR